MGTSSALSQHGHPFRGGSGRGSRRDGPAERWGPLGTPRRSPPQKAQDSQSPGLDSGLPSRLERLCLAPRSRAGLRKQAGPGRAGRIPEGATRPSGIRGDVKEDEGRKGPPTPLTEASYSACLAFCVFIWKMGHPPNKSPRSRLLPWPGTHAKGSTQGVQAPNTAPGVQAHPQWGHSGPLPPTAGMQLGSRGGRI